MVPPFPLTRLGARHSARVCGIWGMLREKTLSSNGDLQRENSIAGSALAADLVRLKVDVIVAVGSGDTGAAKEATATIPIVTVIDW